MLSHKKPHNHNFCWLNHNFCWLNPIKPPFSWIFWSQTVRLLRVTRTFALIALAMEDFFILRLGVTQNEFYEPEHPYIYLGKL